MPGLEFIVLTGFLGSGKTTLLRDFLPRDEAKDTAVIVNEVGEIGLDGALLREIGGDAAMTTLASGCICCQMGSDLTTTVEALLSADRPGDVPLARLVLETSGLSKPGPILRQLASLAQHRMRVSVVATYDPTRGEALDGIEEAGAQWAGAHRIVVTKADMVPPERFGEATAEAKTVNPLAEIVAASDRAAAVAQAFAPPSPGRLRAPTFDFQREAPHPRIRALLLHQDAIVSYDDLATWLDNLAGLLGDRLLRLKGLLAVPESDAPILVQSVGTLFSQPRPFRGQVPGEGGFLVVIGRDLDTTEIRDLTPRIALRLTSAQDGLRRPMRAETV